MQTTNGVLLKTYGEKHFFGGTSFVSSTTALATQLLQHSFRPRILSFTTDSYCSRWILVEGAVIVFRGTVEAWEEVVAAATVEEEEEEEVEVEVEEGAEAKESDMAAILKSRWTALFIGLPGKEKLRS